MIRQNFIRRLGAASLLRTTFGGIIWANERKNQYATAQNQSEKLKKFTSSQNDPFDLNEARKRFSTESKFGEKFALKFTPRISCALFRGAVSKDVFDRMKFFAAAGFGAVEGVCGQHTSPDMQKRIGTFAKELGLEMGCISAMNEKSCPSMTAYVVPAKKGVKKPKRTRRVSRLVTPRT